MIVPESIDDLLHKAFNLACFIHGDRQTALRIVAGAISKLEVATAAQGKRLYYRPTGRSWLHRSRPDRFRNKVTFSEGHLLQRLVYMESEPYERQKEQGASSTALGEEDFVIRFVKHLVRITTKRNSFYVTLGLSRLLYKYTTAETMEVYNAVIQDPERVKDDYYFRSRKGVLMQELKDRFGDLIEICRGPRGEERFRAHENSGRFVELVRECLSFFTPWHTFCPVPAGIDPITDGIADLSYHGRREEDKIEVERIHAVIHPDCYNRLLKSLGFIAPDERLEVPRFFLSHGDSDGEAPRDDRRHPHDLSEEELIAIKTDLEDQSARRKSASAGLLRIVVDGTERACLDINQSRSVRLLVDGNTELIEVRAEESDRDLPLASHLLAYTEADEAVRHADTSIVLEGGQKLSILISPADGSAGAVVDVSYQETNPLRAAPVYFRQLVNSTNSEWFEWTKRKGWSRAMAMALACAFLVICAIAITLYVQRRQPQPTQPAVANNERVDRATEGDNLVSQTGTQNKSDLPVADKPSEESTQKRDSSSSVTKRMNRRARSENARRDETVARADESDERVAAIERAAPEDEATRSLETRTMPVALRDVKKIYVELPVDTPLNQALREMLIESLRASKKLTSAQSRDEADALLKVSVGNFDESSESASIVVRLFNAHGTVIWPVASSANSGRAYRGRPSDTAASIIKDLLNEIQKSERQR